MKEKGLDENGFPVLYVVIDEQFSHAVRSNARFWCVSATSVQAGPGGLKLNLVGLAALLQGGVAFDFFDAPGDEVTNGARFELFANEQAARLSTAPLRISFDDGQGLLAGQTQLRYLGMPVGLVNEARPDPSTGKVEVVARLESGYDILRRAGTVFSLIRPRISLQGVSGLETLVSGVYIECVPGPPGEPAERFIGRTSSDQARDIAEAENEGINVTLRAKDIPSIGKGTPVHYRGLIVGEVKEKALNETNAPFLSLRIRKEFAQTVRRNSRFWRQPASSVQAGPGVLKMDVVGLEALLQGGIQFDVFEKPAEAAGNGAQFELFPNEVRRPMHLASDSNFFREWPGTSRRPDAIALSRSAGRFGRRGKAFEGQGGGRGTPRTRIRPAAARGLDFLSCPSPNLLGRRVWIGELGQRRVY